MPTIEEIEERKIYLELAKTNASSHQSRQQYEWKTLLAWSGGLFSKFMKPSPLECHFTYRRDRIGLCALSDRGQVRPRRGPFQTR